MTPDLTTAMLPDRHRLQRLARDIRERKKQNKPFDVIEARFNDLLAKSQGLAEQRRAALPAITFPPELPVSQKQEDIAALIAAHQVVIVAGETGSGKTTQLPKICLAMGRGVYGTIGHTQPRRIAARTVANRIAEELNVNLGESVGYQVRFTDHSTPQTHIKLMTDGILLAEIQNDRFLSRYDTLIIDEAHERSLNIDFLLGYLKQLLPKRPDLKVIITSATIDVERLSKHFDDAPVIQVSGRTFPVDVFYRPIVDRDEDLISAIVSTIEEIVSSEQSAAGGMGDILVFLTGERDIRETALALRKANIPHLDVLPLYARLSLAEQNRVFQSHRGRRVVLATNVAETSITVPGIRYVIDPGLARISRYSYRTKVWRLPIEPISQASANQRKGRSGRVSHGVCFRLYDEADFNTRPEYTEAEILRSNLASVILQMAQLRLGDIQDFPFVDSPDRRFVNDGYKLLEELQALDTQGKLTPIGKQLTRLPVDPRLGRMCLAAAALGCLKEVLIIVSAISIQDPRERPADKQQAADEKHRRFWEPNSDFLAYLKLWDYNEQQRQDLTQNQFRNLCKKEFLSFLRLREWRDLHHQLRLAAKHLNLRENREPASFEAIHRALLTGLLGNIGTLTDERDYLGPRNQKFSIFPGSSLFKARPKWVMAGELLETAKLYAHTIAKVEPEWILAAADHLVKRHHYEPHYDAKRGQVMAYERITLYGLVLVEKRRVNYGEINKAEAHELFLRHALVEGRYRNSGKGEAPFARHNRLLLQELTELEAKSRRRDILAEDREQFTFFAERVPEHVVNVKGFDAWRKQAERENPKLLFLPRERLMQHTAEEITEAQFPNELEWQGLSFPLSYHFEPGKENDGVSIHVPIHNLHLLPEARLEWLVPGMLRDKCVQLVKALPKQWRKNFVPVPDTVDRVMPILQQLQSQSQTQSVDQPLTQALSQALLKVSSVNVPLDAWQLDQVDPFYHFNIRVLNDEGKFVDSSRDLKALKALYRDRLQESLRSAGETLERENLQSWDFGDLPESHSLQRGKVSTIAFPGLVDEGESVALRLFDDPSRAEFLSRAGMARLALFEYRHSAKYLKKGLFKNAQAALKLNAFGNREALQDDLLMAAAFDVCLGDSTLPRTQKDFAARLEAGRNQFNSRAQNLEALVMEMGEKIVAVQTQIGARSGKPLYTPIHDNIREQLRQLIRPGFLFNTPRSWLEQYPRFIQAIELRLQKSESQVQKDHEKMRELEPFWRKLDNYWQGNDEFELWRSPELQNYRWLLEEFRVSLFAQPMKTSQPVSPKRLEKQ